MKGADTPATRWLFSLVAVVFAVLCGPWELTVTTGNTAWRIGAGTLGLIWSSSPLPPQSPLVEWAWPTFDPLVLSANLRTEPGWVHLGYWWLLALCGLLAVRAWHRHRPRIFFLRLRWWGKWLATSTAMVFLAAGAWSAFRLAGFASVRPPVGLVLAAGRVQVESLSFPPMPGNRKQWDVFSDPIPTGIMPWYERAGMTWPQVQLGQPWVVVVPVWLLLLVAVPPCVLLWRLDGGETQVDGCSHCSYDLTGNESGTCPECGKPIDRAVD